MENEGLGFWFWLFVLMVVNQVVAGCFCGYVAEQKNRDYWNWFFLGAIFGPMPIALMALIAVPSLTDEQRNEWQRQQSEKRDEWRRQQSARHRHWQLMSDAAGLRALSHDDARSLAQHNGPLRLNFLTTLSDEAAKALAEHEGELYLNGLTTLSDEAATALAQHKGWLHLCGLTTLSVEAAKALRANPDIVLPDKFKR